MAFIESFLDGLPRTLQVAKEFTMQQFPFSLAFALALSCAGCGQPSSVVTVTASVPAATKTATQAASAPSDPAAQCESWGIQRDSDGFKQCVEGMTEAANAEASDAQSAEPAQSRAARMRADMARQGDDIRKRVNDEIKAGASNSKCVTVTNGSNTSVSCP